MSWWQRLRGAQPDPVEETAVSGPNAQALETPPEPEPSYDRLRSRIQAKEKACENARSDYDEHVIREQNHGVKLEAQRKQLDAQRREFLSQERYHEELRLVTERSARVLEKATEQYKKLHTATARLCEANSDEVDPGGWPESNHVESADRTATSETVVAEVVTPRNGNTQIPPRVYGATGSSREHGLESSASSDRLSNAEDEDGDEVEVEDGNEDENDNITVAHAEDNTEEPVASSPPRKRPSRGILPARYTE